MKHVRTFENNKYYNVDDYILIKNGILIDGYQLGKIIGVYADPNYYDIKFTDGWLTDIPGKFISRLLTPDEIDKYEAEVTSKKYNL